MAVLGPRISRKLYLYPVQSVAVRGIYPTPLSPNLVFPCDAEAIQLKQRPSAIPDGAAICRNPLNTIPHEVYARDIFNRDPTSVRQDRSSGGPAVLHQLAAPGLDPLPLLRLLILTHVAEDLPPGVPVALLIPGAPVGDTAAAGEGHPEYALLHVKADAADLGDGMGPADDTADGGLLQGAPELTDTGAALPPEVHGLLHLLLRHTQLVRAEGFHGSDAAAVAAVVDKHVRYREAMPGSGVDDVVDSNHALM